jgi:hypothetical protein
MIHHCNVLNQYMTLPGSERHSQAVYDTPRQRMTHPGSTYTDACVSGKHANIVHPRREPGPITEVNISHTSLTSLPLSLNHFEKSECAFNSTSVPPCEYLEYSRMKVKSPTSLQALPSKRSLRSWLEQEVFVFQASASSAAHHNDTPGHFTWPFPPVHFVYSV